MMEISRGSNWLRSYVVQVKGKCYEINYVHIYDNGEDIYSNHCCFECLTEYNIKRDIYPIYLPVDEIKKANKLNLNRKDVFIIKPEDFDRKYPKYDLYIHESICPLTDIQPWGEVGKSDKYDMYRHFRRTAVLNVLHKVGNEGNVNEHVTIIYDSKLERTSFAKQMDNLRVFLKNNGAVISERTLVDLYTNGFEIKRREQ